MSPVNLDKTRYSACIAFLRAETNDVKFYRVADYYPGEDDDLIPSLSQSDCDPWDQDARAENPDYIYCKEAHTTFSKRNSDIYFLEWKIDPEDHRKQHAKICRGLQGLPTADDIREVITIPGVVDGTSLVKALEDGYELGGITTREFYLAYQRRDRNYDAIKCTRKDFVSSKGELRLSKSISNVRSSILSAPTVILDESCIIKSPHYNNNERQIYSELNDLEETGRLLLRPLSYFAADYVKYYLKQSQSDKLTNKERSYAVNQAIENALSRPNYLEEYLSGADYPKDEIDTLKHAISLQMKEQNDDALMLVRDSLLDDTAFRDSCIKAVRDQFANCFVDEQTRVDNLKSQAVSATHAIEESKRIYNKLSNQLSELKADIAEKELHLSELKDSEEQVTHELEKNIALKLGLRVIADGQSSRAPLYNESNDALLVNRAADLKCDESNDSLSTIIETNMRKLGVTAFSENKGSELYVAAQAIVSCLGANIPMAVPEPIADAVADSLAAALHKTTPTRIVVPADYHDVPTTTDVLSKPGVYIIDGVIDTANESLLFPLLHHTLPSTLVFSFRSHASALLLARESWDGMFLLPVESLTRFPLRRKPQTLLAERETSDFSSIRQHNVVDMMQELQKVFSGVELPFSSLSLPATIAIAAEGLDDNLDVDSLLLQHLAFASGMNPAIVKTLAEMASTQNDNRGLIELCLKTGATDACE